MARKIKFLRQSTTQTTPPTMEYGQAALLKDGTFFVTDENGAAVKIAKNASPSLTGTPLAPTAVKGTNTTQIATTQFVKAEFDGDVSELNAQNTPLAMAGTAPNFSFTNTVPWTSIPTGKPRTLIANADSGTSPKISPDGLTALDVWASTGVRASWKAGQVLRIVKYGTGFFLTSSGGSAGLTVPTPIPGGVLIYEGHDSISAFSIAYAVKRTLPAFKKAGTYSFVYNLSASEESWAAFGKIAVNGVDVAASEMNTTFYQSAVKPTSVTVAVGDVITFLMKVESPDGGAYNTFFGVYMGWDDLADILGTIL